MFCDIVVCLVVGDVRVLLLSAGVGLIMRGLFVIVGLLWVVGWWFASCCRLGSDGAVVGLRGVLIWVGLGDCFGGFHSSRCCVV